MSKPTVLGLDFIMLPTSDLERAERFYTEVLGMKVESRWRDMGIEFELGDDLTLALMDPSKMGREFEPASSGTVALKVDGIDAMVESLKSKGVEFYDIIDSGVCKMAIFGDPDGNTLMLHHRYAP